MKTHQDLKTLPSFRNAVITIGSFDGVHLGHQQIIRQIQALAQEVNGETVVITFNPHPRLVLNPSDDSMKLVNTLPEKLTLLEAAGIDHVVVVHFDKKFAGQSPDEYIKDFLVKNFKPSIIAIGYDHRFGKKRAGDFNYLKRFETTFGYKVIEISRQDLEQITISSSNIRRAVAAGKIAHANELLGTPFRLSGLVVHGQQLGNKIGFPTANLAIETTHKLLPPHGVYAVKVMLEKKEYLGMMSIGNRPTVQHNLPQSIEVNIFDFNQDIYGETLLVSCIAFLRPNQPFETIEALQKQLKLDEIQALSVLGK
jgi:riboflavin kinase / FMN adenylyltransferase